MCVAWRLFLGPVGEGGRGRRVKEKRRGGEGRGCGGRKRGIVGKKREKKGGKENFLCKERRWEWGMGNSWGEEGKKGW